MPRFILSLMPWFVLHIYYIGAHNTTVYVTKGKSAVLECQVYPKNSFTWAGPVFCYTDRLEINPKFSNKVKIVGNITNGEYNMQIDNVNEKDEGIYRCVESTFDVTFVTLIIQVKPKNLTIHGTVDGKLFGQEGKSLQLLCSVISYIPKETLTWYNMSSAIGTGGPETLNITITPTRYDHQKTYTCRVSSVSLQESLQETVTLDIQYKPRFAATTENIQYGRIGTQINLSVIVYCYPEFNSLNIITSDFCCFNETKYQLVTDFNITVSTFGQTVRIKGYKISLQGFTLTKKDFTTYNFWIQNKIGQETFSVKLLARDYDCKSQSGYGSWLTLGCLVGGIVICSLCSHIYCYLKRKSRINVMIETYPEEHYDEIETINYNNVAFQPPTDVTQENDNRMSIIAGDSDIMLRVESQSSEESSLERLTGFSLSGDGYENPYLSINPENIEMHPYSSIVSKIYQNTIVFPATPETKNIKESNIAEENSKNPWLIIYNKEQ